MLYVNTSDVVRNDMSNRRTPDFYDFMHNIHVRIVTPFEGGVYAPGNRDSGVDGTGREDAERVVPSCRVHGGERVTSTGSLAACERTGRCTGAVPTRAGTQIGKRRSPRMSRGVAEAGERLSSPAPDRCSTAPCYAKRASDQIIFRHVHRCRVQRFVRRCGQ